MKVSIITPSFDQKRYIGKCIESVLSQTYGNLEHIIVDNLSTDGTSEVLRNYCDDKRLKVISEKDNGQGDAVNKGLALSTGHVVMWLNSDDYLSSPNVVEEVVNIFQKNRNIDAVYGGVTFFDQVTNHRRYVPPLSMLYDMFRYIAFIGNSNIFLKRKIFEKHQVSVKLHFVIDHEWLLRIFRGEMHYKKIPISITDFRRHPEAKTSVYDQGFKTEEGKIRDQTSRRRDYFNTGFLTLYRCCFFILTLKARFRTPSR